MKDEKTIAAELTPEETEKALSKLKKMANDIGWTDKPEAEQQELFNKWAADPKLMRALGRKQEGTDRPIVISLGEDGTARIVTGSDILKLINMGSIKVKLINMGSIKVDHTPMEKWEPPSASDITVGSLLEYVLETVDNNPDIIENQAAAKTIQAIRQIYEYMQTGGSSGELEKFLQDPAAFMPIARPAGIEDLLSVYSAGQKDIIVREFANGNKVTASGRLGLDERKIDEMIRLYFISNNHYRAKTGLNRLIELPLQETMDILGKSRTKDNVKKFAAQLRKEILPAIAHQHLEATTPDGSFVTVEVGGGYRAANVRKDKIYFTVSEEYALYLNTGSLRQYSSITLRLGTAKKPLAFYLAMKMQDHYYSDRNRAKGTNCILSIKTLLDFSKDIVPSYEDVQRTDRGHWQERIRKPLEDALTEMQDKGLFKWEYCKKSLGAVTPQEIRTNDYRQWSKLYITFEIIPKEPDQAQRLENKRERIEAAAEKKAIKDAKALVQADKIEQRKARAGSKSK